VDRVSELPLLPDQPSTTDQVRRFGPPALIAIASVLFILQNTETVSFNFLWFEFRWPLWIMLIVFMVAGAIVAYGITRRIRSRRAARAD
jgi:uncharacterized integral membrane protein